MPLAQYVRDQGLVAGRVLGRPPPRGRMEKPGRASLTESVPSVESLRPVKGKVSGPRWHWLLRFTRQTWLTMGSTSSATLAGNSARCNVWVVLQLTPYAAGGAWFGWRMGFSAREVFGAQVYFAHRIWLACQTNSSLGSSEPGIIKLLSHLWPLSLSM